MVSLTSMSGVGFNAIEALRSRVLMDVKTLGQKLEKGWFFDCIVNTCTRKEGI